MAPGNIDGKCLVNFLDARRKSAGLKEALILRNVGSGNKIPGIYGNLREDYLEWRSRG